LKQQAFKTFQAVAKDARVFQTVQLFTAYVLN